MPDRRLRRFRGFRFRDWSNPNTGPRKKPSCGMPSARPGRPFGGHPAGPDLRNVHSRQSLDQGLPLACRSSQCLFPGPCPPGGASCGAPGRGPDKAQVQHGTPATPPCLHQAQAVTPVGSGAGRTGTVRASRIRRLKALGTHAESHPGDPLPERPASPATRTGQPESRGIQPKNQSNQIREITSIDGSQAGARSVHFFVSVIRGQTAFHAFDRTGNTPPVRTGCRSG